LQFVSRPGVSSSPEPWIGDHESFVTRWLELDPARVMAGEVWRLLTYSFLHDMSTFWHILFNMLFLWMFGSDVEGMYGTREFLLFYLTAAILGGVAFTLWALSVHQNVPCLGASGAVIAVMVLYACHFPTRLILVFFILPVPVWLLVAFYVAQDLFTFLGGARTGTAVTVHLAGAAFGFGYYKFHWRLSGFASGWRTWKVKQRRPALRVVRPDGEVAEPVAVASPSSPNVDEQLEAKLDEVLAKVARKGQASLTDTEREILLRASEIYKRRRS
jgi:membrane associated rhomboid family serine protease